MQGNDDKTDKKNMRICLIGWSMLFTICMAVMLSFAANKTVVIADTSGTDPNMMIGTQNREKSASEYEIVIDKGYGMKESLCVPLPKGIRAENVKMENRYMSRELWLYIETNQVQFLRDNSIVGDNTSVLRGSYEVQDSGILLKLTMSEVFEFRSTMENSCLTIEWYSPKELYDYVLVLDPMTAKDSGMNEITLGVARQIQKLLDMPELKVYITATEEDGSEKETSGKGNSDKENSDKGSSDIETPDGVRWVRFAEDVDADFYIALSVAYDQESPDQYGICGKYNDTFFIPGYGSVDLADTLTRNVTIVSKNRALGLMPLEGDSYLRSIKTPAAEISLGFLSNTEEAILLAEGNYREKLAEGVVKAIDEAIEKLKEQKEMQ